MVTDDARTHAALLVDRVLQTHKSISEGFRTVPNLGIHV
jgi:hypothetical protein